MVGLWFGFVIVNSIFTFFWDIKYDWGLLEKDHAFIRRQQIFPKYCYWIAVFIDFVIRFFWLLSFLFTQWNLWDANISFAFECLELFRRWMWVFLRIEKELVFRASYLDPTVKRKLTN
eukprot:NODE_39_length_35218_cov_0.479655.p36 type:complete len:118 gc:universal NODE_39_length_35218_cov_0.479655:23933-24286(+)